MTVASTSRPQSVFLAVIDAAPAAAIVQWGILILAFFTSVEPYAVGTWGIGALVGLVALGMLAGLAGGGAFGASGAIVGFAAAVAIQLFVLVGQAVGNIGVVAGLGEPPWSERVAAALAIGLAAVIGGYLLVTVGRAVSGRRRGELVPGPGWSRRVVLVAGVLVATGLVTALLLASAAKSAYVMPSDQPSVGLEVDGDQITSGVPVGLLAGRTGIDVRRIRDGLGDIAITSRLTPAESVALESGRVPYEKINETFIGGSTGTREERRHVQFEGPGIYAFVIWDGLHEPDAAGSSPVHDAQVFEVVAGPSGASGVPIDGGALVTLGALLGVLLGGLSAAGIALVVRRRRWIDGGGPRTRHLGVAAAAGTVAALLLGGYALIAIDLARNPF